MNTLLLQWKKIALGTLIGTVLGTATGYAIFIKSPPMWEGTSTLQITEDSNAASGTVNTSNLIEISPISPFVVAQMVRSKQLILNATNRIGHPELAHALMDQQDGGEGMLRLKIIRNSPLITITFLAPSKEQALLGTQAVSTEILRSIWERRKPLLDYSKQFIDQSEVLIEKDKQNYDLITEKINRLKQGGDLTDATYANLLLQQSQNVNSRSQLLSRIVNIKMNYLSVLAKSPISILEATVPEQQVFPNLFVLLMTGAIIGLLTGAALASLSVVLAVQKNKPKN